MTIIYTWNITNLECSPDLDNDCDTIVAADWNVVGTDGTYSSSFSGKTALNIPINTTETPSELPFYHDVTLEQVVLAVKTALSEQQQQVSSIENTIATNIAQQIPSANIMPALPWVV